MSSDERSADGSTGGSPEPPSDRAGTSDDLTPPASGGGTRHSDASMSGSSARLVGCRLGDYQVLRKLGRGGMADVYAARHLTLGRDVAIKVLRSEFASDHDYVERFRREARAAAKLNHPCIVQVYDVGSVGEFHYIAQELIDGENLREYCSRVGSITPEEAVDVLIGVGSALEAAAEMGITHRDIKPENVMRSSKGVIKVADFGLARLGPEPGQSTADLTRVGLTMGTPRYMSPEQVQGHKVDVRSDLYSLGVTVYQLLAGRPPFEADDPLALAVMHLHETPEPLDRARGINDLPEWLIAVVARLMQKRPADRFQSPTQLLDSVRAKAASSDAVLHPVGTAAATVRLQRISDEMRRTKRRRLLRGLAAGLVVCALTAAATAASLRTPARSVERLLTPDEVPRAETVEEQYFVGLRRNDPAGWLAVGEYFPPDANATHADYYHKSMLQLARWYVDNAQWGEARSVLQDLLARPTLSKLHRVIALVRLCQAADGAGDDRLVADARRRLNQAFSSLKVENPTSLELFRSVIPEEVQLQWLRPDANSTPVG